MQALHAFALCAMRNAAYRTSGRRRIRSQASQSIGDIGITRAPLRGVA